MDRQKQHNSTDIVLINPPIRRLSYGRFDYFASIGQPLGIGLLASNCIKENLKCEIIDADAEYLDHDEVIEKLVTLNPKMVGISTMTPTMTSVGLLLSKIKSALPDTIRILGGFHATALPEKTLKEEDVQFIIRGEGIEILPMFIKSYLKYANNNLFEIPNLSWIDSNGHYCENPIKKDAPELDDLPWAAWDKFKMDNYRAYQWHGWGTTRKPYAVIYSSLGCPYNCRFCAVNMVYQRKIRFRSPENIVSEIDYLVKNYGVKTYWIKDDTFNINRKRVIDICNLLIERNYNLNIYCYCRSEGLDVELAKLMYKAGFRWIAFGVEVGTQEMLDQIKKDTTQEKIEKAFKAVHDAGMFVAANYLLGFEEDTEDSCQKTIQFAKYLNADYSWFGLVVPYPGTELYNDIIKKNIVLPEKWENFGHYVGSPIKLGNVHSERLMSLRQKAHIQTQFNIRYIYQFVKTFGVKSFFKDYLPRLWITCTGYKK